MPRVISAEIQAKGAAALAEWRKRKAAAVKKGGKFFKQWEEEERIKREQKKVTPMMAIKNFCNGCVGGIRVDIKNCTTTHCPLFIYRPYRKDEE